jgi:hypothetical protein
MTTIATLTDGHSFMATTPAAMETAQIKMVEWCDVRLETEKQSLAELERTIAEAQNAGMKTHSWKAMMAKSRAKMMFYRKVKSALMQGYYIVPPFPVQDFAIRTNAAAPRGTETTHHWNTDFKQKAKRLEEGEGDWYSPFPEVRQQDRKSADKEGKQISTRYFWPEKFEAVDFPFKMVKPEIIAVVGRAMQQKIFDSLGILPHYKTPDPLVVGQLIPPHRPHDPLTFFVAWWMDPTDL